MIKVKNLKYKYRRSAARTLDDVSFTVREGEIVALVGKNGSGKSTIGKIVAGIIRPKKGEVIIDDIDAGARNNFGKIFERVGIVFQNPETQIIFNNVREEMCFACARCEVSNEAIEAALEAVGMKDAPVDDLWDFSLGQKQRIVLAEMLARKPRYLVLDEPTTMIDSLGKSKIYEIIRKLKAEGMGILLISNSAEEIRIADRVVVLSGGKIVEEVEVKDLARRARDLEKYGVLL